MVVDAAATGFATYPSGNSKYVNLNAKLVLPVSRSAVLDRISESPAPRKIRFSEPAKAASRAACASPNSEEKFAAVKLVVFTTTASHW